MITLDGHTYGCLLTGYRHTQRKFAGEARGNTGAFITIETGVFDNRYPLTLVCDTDDIKNLRTSFAKAAFTNAALDFIDEEGTHWNPNATGDGILNSGVYFHGDIDPDPMAPTGWQNGNRFQLQIELIVNAAGLASEGSGGGIMPSDAIYEIPGGTINGTNDTFTLAESAKVITFLPGFIPQTGDVLFCWYTADTIILVRNLGVQQIGTQFTWA